MEQGQDFISFSERGNNFHVLNGRGNANRTARGGRFDPITFDDTDDSGDGELEDGELITDNGSEEETSEDLDMRDMMINVQVDQTHNHNGKGSDSARPRRPEVMFPIIEAISIYRTLYDAGFPLSKARLDRYGIDDGIVLGAQTQTLIRNDDNSDTFAQYEAITLKTGITGDAALGLRFEGENAARDYVFNFGIHKGSGFNAVPESYLKTIGGNPFLLDQHPGIKEAFDFHRPGMRRTEPTQAQVAAQEKAKKVMEEKAASGPKTRSKSKTTFFDITTSGSSSRTTPAPIPPKAPTSTPSVAASAPKVPTGPKSSKKKKTWEDFTFPANSAHAKKRLDQVDENYLKTLEGMAHVMRKWPGLKEALRDYNEKTGRIGRG